VKKAIVGICPALLLAAGCANPQDVEASEDFRELLTLAYEIPEDRIVTTPVEDGVAQAELLIEADTCRVELGRWDEGDTGVTRVKILQVGEWTPPADLWLLRDPQDREDQLGWLCEAYSPPKTV
jgi:hypothetical protein